MVVLAVFFFFYPSRKPSKSRLCCKGDRVPADAAQVPRRVLDVVPGMEPPEVVDEYDGTARQVGRLEMKRRVGSQDLYPRQGGVELVEGVGGHGRQRCEDVAPEAQGAVAAARGEQPARDGRPVGALGELSRDGDLELVPCEGQPRARGELADELVGVCDGEGAAAEVVVAEDLEGEEARRGILVAAVCVPGELGHGLGAGLVVARLEVGCGRAHVPEPAAAGTVGDGQLVAVVLVKTGDEVLEVCALWVGEVERDLEDALALEMVSDEVDVAGLPGVEEVRRSEVGD